MPRQQTTPQKSAILPIFQRLIFPGMKLIGWQEDNVNSSKNPGYDVYLEHESGEGDCLHLMVEFQEGWPPCGSHWSITSRENVAWSLAGVDPECEARNYLASSDPFWLNAIAEQRQIAGGV